MPLLEPGTWNLEPGTWNLEPGTWNLEPTFATSSSAGWRIRRSKKATEVKECFGGQNLEL